MLCIASEKLQNLLHAQFASTSLAAFDCLVGQLAFLFLKVKDTLFDCVFDGDFVDYYVDFLSKAMNTVDGLFFDELVILLASITLKVG